MIRKLRFKTVKDYHEHNQGNHVNQENHGSRHEGLP